MIEELHDEQIFLGEGDTIQALDISLQTMEQGESALIYADLRHCQGSLVPHHSSKVKIELQLHQWQKPPDIETLSVKERIRWAEKKRQRGNFHYHRQDYSPALQSYLGARRFLDTDFAPIESSADSQQTNLLNELFLQVENNLAQVYLNFNKYQQCLNATENILKRDPTNVKGLFRRAKALIELDKYHQALHTLKSLRQIQKQTTTFAAAADIEHVQRMIEFCQNKFNSDEKNERETYRRMFQRQTTTTTDRQHRSKKVFSTLLRIVFH